MDDDTPLTAPFGTAAADDPSEADALDAEVRNLLNALATEEFGHDEAWVEVSQAVDSVEGDSLPDAPDDPLRYPGTSIDAGRAEDTDDTSTNAFSPASAASDRDESDRGDEDWGDKGRGAARWMSDDDFAAEIAADITPKPNAQSILKAATKPVTDAALPPASEQPEQDAPQASEEIVREGPVQEDSIRNDSVPDSAAQADAQQADAEQTEPETAPDTGPSADMLSLQAIELLGDRIAASEGRYDTALGKMGHALGVIAQRIDSLEGRMTNQAIANVALAAAPPEIEDHSVAPYIARAERELEARNRKESGSMDIFDRIAQAAENEFDDRSDKGDNQVVPNTGDGRRVGTKKWQPSKTVKRRMAQLEKSRTDAPADGATPPQQDAARSGPALDPEEFAVERDAESTATAEPVFESEEEDDSGLSVLPGARGRRRNRARKSRLDEDFENVFEDEGGKPSIQSLRRKMRERPADEPEIAEPAKSGMLSGLLGKKSARNTAPVALDDVHDVDEEDLLAAFDAPGEEALTAPKRSGKSKHVDIDEEEYDDDDDGWDDEDTGSGSRRKPILVALAAAAAGAGYFAWKTFLG